MGRNPVVEALKAQRSINKILAAKGDKRLGDIVSLAKQSKVIVQEVDVNKLNEIAGGLKHQGIIAYVAPVEYVDLDSILNALHEKNEIPFFILLDELTDPHNVGAILRTADAVGANAMLIPKRRSCPLTATVAKTSAGAVEYVPVAHIGNVAQTIKKLKENGLWIVGLDMDGEKYYYEAELKGPLVLVVGSEGEGLSRLTKESCDYLVKIPMRGKINSLNASVACSLLLYEAARQRNS